MPDRLSHIDSQLQALGDRIVDLERRIAAIETRGAADAGVPVDRGQAATPDLAEAARRVDATAALSLVGRTLVVLAGAYLLRALTDSGTLAPRTGVALGVAYALTWIVMADRAGAKGRRGSAAFHGLAFALIGLPLLFEATLRFKFLSTQISAASLALLAGVALAAAWRHRLRGLAWIVSLGVVATAAVLMTLTGELAPFAVCLVLLGVATLWFGYVLDWLVLRWPVAFVTDLTLLVLSARAVGPRSADTPEAALVVQVLLLALYLGSFATRTLFLNRDVIPFEVVQSVAVIAVGLGGAAYVTHATGVGEAQLGAASLALGLGCYTVALVFVERRQRRRRNFHFYALAALVFTLTGCALVLSGAALAVTLAVCTLTASAAGRALTSLTLKSHAVVYAVAAATASPLLAHAAHGLGAPLPQPWPGVPASAVIVLAATIACAWTLVAGGPGPYQGKLSRVPGLLMLTLSVGGLLGVALAWTAPALAGVSPDAPGMVATLRTALLVAATLSLARAARSPRMPEAGWLVYPLLVATGVKFIFEDFRVSRPETLFVAFALYGAALILAPRLRRRAMPASVRTQP